MHTFFDTRNDPQSDPTIKLSGPHHQTHLIWIRCVWWWGPLDLMVGSLCGSFRVSKSVYMQHYSLSLYIYIYLQIYNFLHFIDFLLYLFLGKLYFCKHNMLQQSKTKLLFCQFVESWAFSLFMHICIWFQTTYACQV